MNIYDLISRAQKLRKETQLDSVSPDRVGGLHEDTLKYINEFQLLASSPSLHKIYASVSAMQSDGAPKSDLTGKPLKPGQLVVIVPANQTDATAGDVYRYDGPSGNTSAWTFVAKIGAVPADAELSATSTNPVQNKVVTEKLTELESNLSNIWLFGNDLTFATSYVHLLENHTYRFYILCDNWSINNIWEGAKILSIGHTGIDGITTEDVGVITGGIIKDFYEIKALASTQNNRYAISIRADKGIVVNVVVIDVTSFAMPTKNGALTATAYIPSKTNPYYEDSVDVSTLQIVFPGEKYSTYTVNEVFDMSTPTTCALVLRGQEVYTKAITDVDETEHVLLVRLNGNIKEYIGGALYQDYIHWVAKEVRQGYTGTDFSIDDDEGNSIVEFYEGHIRTKHFDSSATKQAYQYSHDECVKAFVDMMNKFVYDYGMKNTLFVNASGMGTYREEEPDGDRNTSCPKDFMRLAACATQTDIMKYWNIQDYSVEVGGSNARTITGTCKYSTSEIVQNAGYHIIGGKTGSWTKDGILTNNITLVVKSKVNDDWLVGTIMKADTSIDRDLPIRDLFDWLEEKRQNPSTPTPTLQCEYACAGIVPKNNPIGLRLYDFSVVEKNGESSCLPASMTKIMTGIVALNFCKGNEIITIEATDMRAGSGDEVFVGDEFTLWDALVVMHLSSSNTLATAISRFVGNIILNNK